MCWFAPLLLHQGFAVCIARCKETLITTVDVEYGNKEMSVQHKSPAAISPARGEHFGQQRYGPADEETLTTSVDVEYCRKEIKPQQQSLEAASLAGGAHNQQRQGHADEETLITSVDVEYCHKEIKPQQQSLEASMTNSVKDMLVNPAVLAGWVQQCSR